MTGGAKPTPKMPRDNRVRGGRFNATALRLAVCDQLHRGTVRYVMASLVVTAYTDIIDCG